MREILLALVVAFVVAPATPQEPVAAPAEGRKLTLIDGKPTLFIEPTEDGFHVYVTAAIHKKGVQVAVVEDQQRAMYTLKAAQVETKKVGTGNKLVNCLFVYCAGNSDKANVSVQLVRDGVIVWSYSVNKGRGEKNRQSMAEAIAKHLKEYLEKNRALPAVG